MLFACCSQAKSSTWFFSLAPRSINSWKQFETTFTTQFGNVKTSGTLFLEISRININKKEKIKDFNQIFITLLNRIHDKPAKEIQIEFYNASLPPPVSIFVKRKEKQTLVENFQEAIKVEKDLAPISRHLSNEENKSSTSERNGKKSKRISKSESDKKDKDPTCMESMQ